MEHDLSNVPAESRLAAVSEIAELGAPKPSVDIEALIAAIAAFVSFVFVSGYIPGRHAMPDWMNAVPPLFVGGVVWSWNRYLRREYYRRRRAIISRYSELVR